MAHRHSHNKGGLIGALIGLQNTRSFGAKRRARHKKAKAFALWKRKNPGGRRIDSPFW